METEPRMPDSGDNADDELFDLDDEFVSLPTRYEDQNDNGDDDDD